MQGDHDSARRRDPSASPRGRRPYGEPADPPAPAPADPAASADRARAGAYGGAGDPFIYGSRFSVEVRPTWPHSPPLPPPSPPGRAYRSWPRSLPWSWSWPQSLPRSLSWPRVTREQLLRPALICGFLAATGVGLWSSGWSPTSPATTTRTITAEVTAARTPSGVTGHGAVIAFEGEAPPAGHLPVATPRTVTSAKPARSRKPASSHTAGRPRNRTVPGVRAERHRHRLAVPRRAGAVRPKPPAPHARAARHGERSRHGDAAVPTVFQTPSASAIPDISVIPETPEDRLSAAYACRHLRPGDGRYAYCVRAWNDYKRQKGLP
ncbi:hypothetical protein [Streptosporangium sp. NBC_01756]|uniref:hypothetical protein n=1 Tax=Streptosporangium sp. NBC_01756 TaxID=2975950 RepID=UPI002DD835C2|nr:hypothetical protein [Streptosporangium sp. NBC_01756]WSC86398.1 hypothetical protein OIE48_39645 [Streptosporangium sp. NBC_01756]